MNLKKTHYRFRRRASVHGVTKNEWKKFRSKGIFHIEALIVDIPQSDRP